MICLPSSLLSATIWSRPYHILLMTIAPSSVVASLYKLVFTLLQVIFLEFDADHVILRLKNVPHVPQSSI